MFKSILSFNSLINHILSLILLHLILKYAYSVKYFYPYSNMPVNIRNELTLKINLTFIYLIKIKL